VRTTLNNSIQPLTQLKAHYDSESLVRLPQKSIEKMLNIITGKKIPNVSYSEARVNRSRSSSSSKTKTKSSIPLNA
jgi:hypothetical protein